MKKQSLASLQTTSATAGCGGLTQRVAMLFLGAAAMLAMAFAAPAQVNFNVFTNYTPYTPSGSLPARVILGDLNADGRLDCVVSHGTNATGIGGDYLSVLTGNGNGTFREWTNQVTGLRYLNNGGNNSFIASGDVNRDGFVDILSANYSNSTVSLFFGAGQGNFELRQDYPAGAGSKPQALAIGDLNHDGINDFAVIDQNSQSVLVYLAKFPDTFQGYDVTNYAVGNAPAAIVKGDFNEDGNIDLAVANGADGTVSILLGYGDGTYANQVVCPVVIAGGWAGVTMKALAVADFDRDGYPDLLLATGDRVVGFKNNAFAQFQTAFEDAAPGCTGLTVGDFNRNGFVDYAVTLGGAVAVHVGNGTNYGPGVVFPVSGNLVSIAQGQLNNDQAPDLVVADDVTGDVYVLLNATPFANDQRRTMLENTTTNIILTGTTGIVQHFTVMSGPSHGILTPAGSDPTGATLSYHPTNNYFGLDRFTFITDAGGLTSSVATVTILVLQVNVQPVFSLSTNFVSALEDSLTVTIPQFATGISSGATNERQYIRFLLTNYNRDLFWVQPTISAVGTLQFAPKADTYGTTLVTTVLYDSGGTQHGGIDRSTNQFTIGIQAVNQLPSFTRGANIIVSENCGPISLANWATRMKAGPTNESWQTWVFEILYVSNPALFSSQPVLTPTGMLSFTPAANMFGLSDVIVWIRDNGGRANGGQDTGIAVTFRITVNPVNQPPSFDFATGYTTVTVLEDQKPTLFPSTALPAAAKTHVISNFVNHISVGPANESSQGYNFIVSTSNDGLFSYKPSLNTAGTLTFMPKANSNGTAQVSVIMYDTGGTANGGHDRITNIFTINVTPVNDAPSMTLGRSVVSVLESSGSLVFPSWATHISTGPADEAGQTLSITLVTSNPGLYSVPPAINPLNGDFTFTPAPGSNGVDVITVLLRDNGGVANGGVDANTVALSFQINVVPVNNAPSFQLTTNVVTVPSNYGMVQTLIANNIVTGPPNETYQTVNFLILNNSNPGLFSVPPTITPAGLLTFTTRGTNYTGTATVGVKMMDNGGVSYGGVNYCGPITLTINITAP